MTAPQAAPGAAPAVTPSDWINYTNTAARVIMWPGAIADMGGEVDALGCRRLMVVCGPNTRRSGVLTRVLDALGGRVQHLFDRVVEHSAVALVEEAAELAREHRIDGFVAVGGGSASDTAKAVAILLGEGGRLPEHASSFVPPDKFYPKDLPSPKLPVIAVPTTASAAEVTPGLGIRDADGRKLLFWHITLASRLIVLDPAANVEVPAPIMAATAMNAFAHCAEGLYSRLRNPISEGLALHGIRLLTKAVPAMVAEPDEVAHRAGVLAGAHLSGMVISNARVGIHHAVCHCLGALGGLSHGVANAIMLPHALAYNLPVAPGALAAIAEAMGADVRGLDEAAAARAGIEAVRKLQLDAGVPTRLRDTGLAEDMLPAIAEHTLADRGLYFNPRPTASAEPILELLKRAW